MKDTRTVAQIIRDWKAKGDRNMVHKDGRSVEAIIATALQMEAAMAIGIISAADVCVEYEKALFVAKREFMRDLQRRLEEKCTDLFSDACYATGFSGSNKANPVPV